MANTNKAGWNLKNDYAQLPTTFYEKINPTKVNAPELVLFNKPLAISLGLNPEELIGQKGAAIFSGNEKIENSEPIAQAYAGHQFGSFSILGDGRAVLIGEQTTPTGEKMDIQLKGSGPTSYSRRGDGRAALGPMLREYIISEAMYGLGIPTTRSLAVVTTGENVIRETILSGAILTRVASSHIRVGTFQYISAKGSLEDLKALADYTIKRHFHRSDSLENPYLNLLESVIERQAELIAKWQLVGFVHGVMNTDNMAISGETIDYGPCAFMDTYDPGTVFSSIDREGRYSYGNQAYMAEWNLARFAETLLPLLHQEKDQALSLGQNALGKFSILFEKNWLAGMRGKLGIFNEEDQDFALIQELLTAMEIHRADYTNTFRSLTLGKINEFEISKTLEFKEWFAKWQKRLGRQKQSEEQVKQLMKANNPSIIPRNHRVEEAIVSASSLGNYEELNQLLDALQDPYSYSPKQERYIEPSDETAKPYRTFCGT